jgi:alkanesulfonate monooxygenase SsuD/methylene tetrahydromethanopterin reductase-like flavin-dependent oxidoreductase (luciferase family)
VCAFEIGVVLPLAQFGPERSTPRWIDIRAMALRAEAMGFDTLWTPDELLWRVEGAAPQGVWDGVSMAGAVAATTSRAKVGTWVLSALHRNPGIIAKTAETLDEISGGREGGPGRRQAPGELVRKPASRAAAAWRSS